MACTMGSSKQKMQTRKTLKSFPYPELLEKLPIPLKANGYYNTWKILISELALQETGQHHYWHSNTDMEEAACFLE